MISRHLHTIVFLVLFTSASAYSVMVYTSGTANVTADEIPAEAAFGKLVYQKYNCQACHQLYGLGGYMGPDLTNVISSPGKGELYARALIANGTAKMPNLHLSESEIMHVTEYLKYVDKTGKFPLYNPDVTFWGDIKLPSTNKNTAQHK